MLLLLKNKDLLRSLSLSFPLTLSLFIFLSLFRRFSYEMQSEVDL